MVAKASRFAVVFLIAAAMVLSCSKNVPTRTVSKTDPDVKPAQIEAGSSNIGLIEHRGRFYCIEDLMDPAYRVDSNDPFVRQFAPDTNVAIPWAGLSREEKNARPSSWAGD